MITKSKDIYIYGDTIKNKNDFFRAIDKLLHSENFIEGGYGYSIYGLWDILSSGAGLNCSLHWKNSNKSKDYLGEEFFNAVIKTLEDAEKVTWPGGYTPFKFYLE